VFSRNKKVAVCIFIVTLMMWIFTLSPVVALGDNYVDYSFLVPEFIEKLWGIFRSTGRFMWPIGYLVMMIGIVNSERLLKRFYAVLLVILVILQFVEYSPYMIGQHKLFNEYEHISFTADAFERELPTAVFQLNIPQVMPVITALVISIVIGLAAVWTNAVVTKQVLAEFQNIVLMIVEKIMIPLLPFYIGTTFATLGYNGTLEQFPVFIKAIIIVMIGHYIWLFVLYAVAGAYSGKNPMEVVKHYGPAYITAVGTMSSAATLSVALDCANKSKVLRKDLIAFGIPLFANIHL
jgi:Na+/H+-dicarboxylate symporter